MNRVTLHQVLRFLIVIWVLVTCLSPGSAPGSQSIPLTIVHLNDLHGHILPYVDKSVLQDQPVSGAAYLAAIIAQERSKNPEGTLLLAAGDMFQGTPISNVFRGRSVIEIMNALKFDAMALGNHEFDWGRDALKGLRLAAGFPFLAANIVTADGKLLAGMKPYILLTRQGVRVAVIGVTTPETAYTSNPATVSDLTFLDPVQVLPPLIEKVRSEGAHLVVLLSHLGLDADEQLAGQIAGIDVIVGGHSHTAVTTPVRINNTIIVQAKCYGVYLGVLEIQIDETTHKIADYHTANVLRTVVADPQAPADRGIAQIVSRYNEQIRTEFSKVIGSSAVDLLRQDYAESNLGNLITDAMREASAADIAFQNGGGIRADLPAGEITLEKLYTLLPFDNQMVVMDLKGSQILELLEKSAEQHARMLQISGLTVEYDITRPKGSRVVQVSVRGKPLQSDSTYRVATNDFLAAAGDQFTSFTQGHNLTYGDTLREIVGAYLQKHSPVRPGLEERMVWRQ
jgi:5'-nucleotidase / UDP-sugar diphosphatase